MSADAFVQIEREADEAPVVVEDRCFMHRKVVDGKLVCGCGKVVLTFYLQPSRRSGRHPRTFPREA